MMISCIMPTADRRRFVADSIRRFLSQDYPDKELIVVDDGSEPIDDLVPKDSRIRYIRQNHRMILGAKRNYCCSLAYGEIIAHWDDDDYYAPWRLTRQKQRLDEGFDVSGLAQVLIYDQRENKAYKHETGPFQGRPWLYGATLCYRKSVWEKNQFRSTQHRGEDDRFVAAFEWPQVCVMNDLEMYVARKHTTNTGFGFEIASTCNALVPFSLDRIKEIMGDDCFRCDPNDTTSYYQWLPETSD